MIYFFSFISGIINGFFASGAGQILVIYLIFILKEETHTSRSTSICCIGIATLISIFRYLKFVEINMLNVVIIVISGLVFGIVGNKFMKKIPSNILNIFSGLIIVIFSIYNLVVK